ncbi:helicase-primase subunit [Equid alphaherpesvirus 3]|uniref:Helicase-primase subunit n=1 Tax=Equid alphaherpesvirus 3 TaxID=80341 RepID=A0A077B9S4_9ALPH|nr:helicase-primase subunit [Equid alphaherpesvirus 3]AIL02971.1 helicase-primase subunit [Equid alphaherpesvirus 3]
MAGRNVEWTAGWVCAASIYSTWTDPAEPGALQALVHLLCRREGGDYAAEFCHVSVAAEHLKRGARDASLATPARAAAAGHRAASPGCWPLAALGQAMLWKAMYGSIAAALRRTLGGFAFYAPLALGVDPATGLLVAAAPAPARAGAAEEPGPRPAILDVSAEVPLDPAAVRAHAANAGGTALARARLCALRDGYFVSGRDASLEVELATRDASFYRKYDSVRQPASKRRGEMSDLFGVEERTLTLPRGRTTRVKVLVPRGFDCLIASSQAASGLAVMTLYRQWHATLFSGAARDVAVPVFAYLGPELNPCGEETDYCCMVGFPGIPTLKAASTTPEAVRDALSAYRFADGLWPALGIGAFHALAPWGPGDRWPGEGAARRLAATASRIEDANADAWPAGRVTCVLESPAALQGPWLAKFDFAAFFPTLYLALFPNHARLAEAVLSRSRGENAALKPALVSFFGGLQHLDPAAYRAIIGLANGISRRLEREANGANFAICTYVKDGFWGVLGDAPSDSVSLAEAGARAEALRAAAEGAAGEHLAGLGLSFPPGVRLRLRLEGLFTDAVSWSTHCYWLRNRETGIVDFVGFPAKSRAGKAAKSSLASLLAAAADVEDAEGVRSLLAAAREACEGIVQTAFAERGNPEFWSAPTPIDSSPLPPAVYDGGAVLDLDRGPREVVHTRWHDCEQPSAVPWRLFPPPRVLGNIDCIAHLTPIFKAFSGLLAGAVEAFCEMDEPPAFEFPLTDYAFLFN